MKVTHLTEYTSPPVVGGSATFAMQLSAALRKSGISELLISRPSQPRLYQHSISPASGLDSSYLYAESRLTLHRLIRYLFQRSSHIIVEGPFIGLLAWLHPITSCTYIYHGPLYREYQSTRSLLNPSRFLLWVGFAIRYFLTFLMCIRARRIVVISTIMEEYLKQDMPMFSGKVLKTLPFYSRQETRLELCEADLAMLNYTEPKHDILICRRLVPRTGVLPFLDLLIQNRSTLSIGVTGAGPLAEGLSAISSATDTIRYYGSVSDNLLQVLLASSNCMVMPSLELEGFGLVVLESIWQGTVPLVSRHSGAAEWLLPYLPGLVFEPTSYASFCESYAYAISCRRDILDTLIPLMDRFDPKYFVEELLSCHI